MKSSKEWICTWSGRQFYPLNPHSDAVSIEDIAWQLAGQNRWKGATRGGVMTIAHHCVIVSHLCDPAFALQGLLHDAPEAYLGDMAGPIKHLLPDFVAAENRLWEVIAGRFGVPVDIHPSVKRADLISLHTESRDLLHTPHTEWRHDMPPPMAETLVPWNREDSALAFLARFNELITDYTS